MEILDKAVDIIESEFHGERMPLSMVPFEVDGAIKKAVSEGREKITVVGFLKSGKTSTLDYRLKDFLKGNGYTVIDVDYESLSDISGIKDRVAEFSNSKKAVIFIQDYFKELYDSTKDSFVAALLSRFKSKDGEKEADMEVSEIKSLLSPLFTGSLIIDKPFCSRRDAENLLDTAFKNNPGLINDNLKKSILEHSSINKTSIPHLISGNSSIVLSSDPKEIKIHQDKIDTRKKYRDGLLESLGLGVETGFILNFLQSFTGASGSFIPQAVMPFLGLGVPFAMMVYSSYQFYKETKKDTYYDKLVKASSYWNELGKDNPVEQKIISYLMDIKNKLKPNESFSLLNGLFSNKEEIEKVRKEMKVLVEENNKELTGLFNAYKNDFEKALSGIYKRLDTIEQDIEVLKQEIQTIKKELEEIKEERYTLGSIEIKNIAELEKNLLVPHDLLENKEIEETVENLLNGAKDNFVLIKGEPGAGKTVLLYQTGKKTLAERKRLFFIEDINRFSLTDFSRFDENSIAIFDINSQATANVLNDKLEAVRNNKTIKLSRLIISVRHAFVENFKLSDIPNLYLFELKHGDNFIKELALNLLKSIESDYIRQNIDRLSESVVEKARSIPLYIQAAAKLIENKKDEIKDIDKIVAELPRGVRELIIKILKEETMDEPFNLIPYYLISHYPFFPYELYKNALGICAVEKDRPKYINKLNNVMMLHSWYKDITDEITGKDNDAAQNFKETLNGIKKDKRLKNIKEDLEDMDLPGNAVLGNLKDDFSGFVKHLGKDEHIDLLDIIDAVMFLTIRSFIRDKFTKGKYGCDIFEERLSSDCLTADQMTVYNYFVGFLTSNYLNNEMVEYLINNERLVYSISVFYLSRFIQGSFMESIEKNLFGKELDANIFSIVFLANHALNEPTPVRNYISALSAILYRFNFWSSLDFKTKAGWLICLQKFDEAIKEYDRAIELDKGSFEAYNNKGIALKSLKRFEEAVKEFDKAIEASPHSFHAYNNKGITLTSLKRFEEAVKEYDNAIRLNPDDPNAYNNKGLALRHLEKYEEAVKEFDKAIKIDPYYFHAYNNKGLALHHLEKHEEAIKEFDKLIELNPNYFYSYNNKATVLNRLERYEEALKQIDKAIELDPYNCFAFDTKGHILSSLKRYEEAIEEFDKAIKLDPDYPNAYSGKAKALYYLKRYEEALKQIDKAIKLDPGYSRNILLKNEILKNTFRNV